MKRLSQVLIGLSILLVAGAVAAGSLGGSYTDTQSTTLFEISLLTVDDPDSAGHPVPSRLMPALDKAQLPGLENNEGLNLGSTAIIASSGTARTRVHGPDEHVYEIRLRHQEVENKDDAVEMRFLDFDVYDVMHGEPRVLLTSKFSVKKHDTIVVGSTKADRSSPTVLVLLTPIR